MEGVKAFKAPTNMERVMWLFPMYTGALTVPGEPVGSIPKAHVILFYFPRENVSVAGVREYETFILVVCAEGKVRGT